MDSPHPLFGAEPWTQQFGQCGISGLNIRLPFPLIVDEPRISILSRKLHSVEISRFLYHEILREINFVDSRSAKTVIFVILESVNFVYLVHFSLQKVQKFIIVKIQSLKMR